MSLKLNRLAHALADLAAYNRRGFKRVDASPALPDDGSWLAPPETGLRFWAGSPRLGM